MMHGGTGALVFGLQKEGGRGGKWSKLDPDVISFSHFLLSLHSSLSFFSFPRVKDGLADASVRDEPSQTRGNRVAAATTKRILEDHSKAESQSKDHEPVCGGFYSDSEVWSINSNRNQ